MCRLNLFRFATLLVTVISAAIILTVTMIEFFDYRRVNVDTSIVVDRSRGEKLTASLNITFPRVPCYRAFSINSWPRNNDLARPQLSALTLWTSAENPREISRTTS